MLEVFSGILSHVYLLMFMKFHDFHLLSDVLKVILSGFIWSTDNND